MRNHTRCCASVMMTQLALNGCDVIPPYAECWVKFHITRPRMSDTWSTIFGVRYSSLKIRLGYHAWKEFIEYPRSNWYINRCRIFHWYAREKSQISSFNHWRLVYTPASVNWIIIGLDDGLWLTFCQLGSCRPLPVWKWTPDTNIIFYQHLGQQPQIFFQKCAYTCLVIVVHSIEA